MPQCLPRNVYPQPNNSSFLGYKSKQLACFWITSSTMSLGNWNPNFRQNQLIFGKINFFLCINQLVTINSRGPKWVGNGCVFSISLSKSCLNMSSRFNTKIVKVTVKKKLWSDFYMTKCTLIYGRNQSGCEKAKSVGFLTSLLCVFFILYIFLL